MVYPSLNSNFIRKATAFQHLFISVCAEILAVGMVITMKDELAVIRTISAVCDTAKSVSRSFRETGLIRKGQRDIMRIKIDAARKACENEEAARLFEYNLDLLERAADYMESKHLTGIAREEAEEQYNTLARKLRANLDDFCRKHPGKL